ncbi:M20 aminoacylase family protein [uncultured Castellaniella sp.]|uniref:M20 aminoacylase family protein n=1 Tax=uncultured Castellaniella sp. TaxID=647907 RepID=UPI0026057615|nr:M20 aminoacylase family protein [uncultured Castellaniella sp.]
MKQAILDTLGSWLPDMTDIRRSIHAWPELAFQEVRTADTVARLLESWGIETQRGLGETGVVGRIAGARAGRSIGLRADMDALPMPEANTFPHASRNPGVMHACGHDGHTTMLLAAARYLAQHRDFPGTVQVIFQPAEEGGGGARRMIEDGLFDQFPMDAVFGMHNWPGLPVGTFGLTEGPIMASSNRFQITLQGRGAHGAMPHLGVDPVVAAAQLTLAFQTILTRDQDPLDAGVISVTQIHAGSADNVIPDQAVLRGTVRTLSTPVLDLIESRMRDLTQHLAAALRCTADFHFSREYPATVNHPAETALCTQVLNELVGADHVRAAVRPSMGAEDFAFMLQARPGCYIWIGNGDGDHRGSGHGLGPCTLHNGSYDFNDELIPLGAAYWVLLAQRYLSAA